MTGGEIKYALFALLAYAGWSLLNLMDGWRLFQAVEHPEGRGGTPDRRNSARRCEGSHSNHEGGI